MKISKEIKVGVMVVVGFFALFFGVNYLKGFNIFIPTNSYYAEYAALDGLEKSAPVLIEGYKVGQINDIEYDFSKAKPFTVRVSLDNDLKIPHGSRLELFDNGLLDGKTIRIVLDKTQTELYHTGDTIASSVARGLMDDVTENIVPGVKGIIPQADSLLIAYRLLAQNQSIYNTLQSLETSGKNLEQITAELKKVLQSDLPVILKDVKAITGNLNSTTTDLDNANIAGTLNKLDSTLQNISNITTKIDKGYGTLGLLINDKALYDKLNTTVNDADLLMIDFKQNPKRYVHFSVFGKSEKK
ncbi:MAG: MlaD family protein [Prevotellaceae bacterium]|jgi:phospholipid/cholesterol/gamma-HCH transport system substrate-binding protein|nr:MlaD family protein [Prevotellaceae bacterium]